MFGCAERLLGPSAPEPCVRSGRRACTAPEELSVAALLWRILWVASALLRRVLGVALRGLWSAELLRGLGPAELLWSLGPAELLRCLGPAELLRGLRLSERGCVGCLPRAFASRGRL